MSQHVVIADADVEIVEYRGERVVTFKQIDRVHRRPIGTAKRNFNENEDRFESRTDFVLVPASQKDEFRTFGIEVPNRGLTVLTRRGYYKLVKSLNDDRAWAVHAEMVDAYFAAISGQPAVQKLPTTAEAFANAFLMIAENERRQAESERRQAASEQALVEMGAKVDRIEVAQTIQLTCPQAAEPITRIRKRIRKQFGLSADVVDAVMRQSPYAPKPATMVRNGHENAEGSTYAVFWKKDISAVFERFASECKPVTPTMAIHPFVERRFKMLTKREAA